MFRESLLGEGRSCRRRAGRSIVLAFAALAVPWTLIAQPLDSTSLPAPILMIDEARFAGGRVLFDVDPPVVARPSFDRQSDTVRRAVVNGCVVSIDLADVRPVKYGAYRYDFFLTDGDRTQKFTAFAHPDGNFPDSLADVSVRVIRGTSAEQTTMRLPVYSPTAPPFLEVAQVVGIPVSTGGPSEHPLPLRNLLKLLPVRVFQDGEPRRRHGEHWREVKLLFQDNAEWSEMSINANDSTSLQLALDPDPWDAVLATVLPATDHDMISLPLRYQSLENGPQHNLLVEIPIRFEPPWQVQVLVVGLGSMIGSLVLLLFDHGQLRRRPLAVVGGLLLAVVVWGVLVATDTSLQVLGRDLSPTVLLPAFLLGVLTVLSGRRVLRWLESAWPTDGILPRGGRAAAASAPQASPHGPPAVPENPATGPSGGSH